MLNGSARNGLTFFRPRRGFLIRNGIPAAGDWSGKPVPLANYRFYETGIVGVVAQCHTDFANSGVYTDIDLNENGRSPKPFGDLFTSNQISVFLHQEKQQLHRPSFEAQNAFSPLQPIPRLVKCEIPEMENVARTCPPSISSRAGSENDAT